MDKQKVKVNRAVDAALNGEGQYARPDVMGNDETIKEMVEMAKAGSHDHARIVIELAVDEVRLACPDSPFVAYVGERLAVIASDPRNVKNAGEILGLSSRTGAPLNKGKPEDELYIALECYLRRKEFEGETALFRMVGDALFGNKEGTDKQANTNRSRAMRACKTWAVLFDSGDVDAINRVLIDNELAPIPDK